MYIYIYVNISHIYPLTTRIALPSTAVPWVKNPLRHVFLGAKEHICAKQLFTWPPQHKGKIEKAEGEEIAGRLVCKMFKVASHNTS